jgi:peptidoglycan/xylan/chitin deacetylase (PgdA/CDA1 family)
MMRMARNMPTIMWSVDPQDWRRPGGFAIADHIIRHAEPGAVVLAHDTVNDTIRNLPHALDTLLAQGYRFVTVSELIGFPAWMERQGARAT